MTSRQRRIERRRLGKRGNGKGRGDHDRRMGDVDDVEQPERDREPDAAERVECAEQKSRSESVEKEDRIERHQAGVLLGTLGATGGLPDRRRT